MRFIVLTHLVLTGSIAGLLAWRLSPEVALIYLWGSALIAMSILVFGLVWLILTRKKLVALGFSLVVVKFSIFGVAIHLLLNFGRTVLPDSPELIHQPAFWLAAGVATITLTVIAGAVRAFYVV